MTAEAELQNSESLVEDNKCRSEAYNAGPSLLFIVPVFALISTFVCTSGWQTGLRATLLGGGLLAGILLTKRFCPLGTKWKKRLAYFIPAGLLGGLLAALVIIALEYFIGSPDPTENPYHQSSENLLWICPLYGFFIFLCYGLAFNLSRVWRFLIVVLGAALANNFCLIDLAVSPNIQEFALGILRNLSLYYIACLGNSFFYMFMFNMCADAVYQKPMKKIGIGVWILGAVASVIVAYFGVMFFGAMTLSIKPTRFIKEHKDTVFKDKMTGVIVFGDDNEYFDCQKRELLKSKAFPDKLKQRQDHKTLKKEFLKQIDFDSYWYYEVHGKAVFYTKRGKLFRLDPPYERPELLLTDNFYISSFCVSPNGKFIAYSSQMNEMGYRVFCIVNLDSRKILAVDGIGYLPRGSYYWLSDAEKEKFIQEYKGRK